MKYVNYLYSFTGRFLNLTTRQFITFSQCIVIPFKRNVAERKNGNFLIQLQRGERECQPSQMNENNYKGKKKK